MNRSRGHHSEDSESQIEREPNVIDVPDLVNMIADYCDDHSLSKLSRV